MPDDRVFSEQEVGDILRRAVHLTEGESPDNYRPGVTLQELQKIAAEVGVSADALRRAILETGERTSKKGPLHLTEEFERVVDGELDPNQFDLLAEGVRQVGNIGQPTMAQIGRTVTMSAWTGLSQARVSVTSRNGRTRLRVKSNAFFQGLMTFYPAFIATVITTAALSERGMAGLGISIGLLLVTLASLVFVKLTNVGHRRCELLADKMRDTIARAITDQGQSLSTPSITDTDSPVQQRLGQG